MTSRPTLAARLLCLAASLLFAASAISADQYPARTIRIIAPITPGGAGDFCARLIAVRLSAAMGQPVVVDNRPGAGGNVGVQAAAKAAPDGYTLVMPITSFPVNPSLYSNLPFDTVKDFSPVVLVGTLPLMLVVNPSVQAKSVAELIALGRAKPRAITFANSGNGTTTYLASELFIKMSGLDMVSVNYRGGGPAVTDLLGGHVQAYFGMIPSVLPHVRSGQLRALAVTGRTRTSEMPSTPTVAESGLPGFEVTAWFGLFAPAGTPEAIVNRLNREVGKILAMPEVREEMETLGVHPGGGTPEALGSLLVFEINKWAKVVKDGGLRLE